MSFRGRPVSVLFLMALAGLGCAGVPRRGTPSPSAAAPSPAPAEGPAESVASTAAASASPAQAPGQPVASARPPSPAEPPAHDAFGRGAQAFRAHRYAEAADAFREVLRGDPGQLAAQVNLGLAYERLGDLGSAHRAFESARRLAPEDVSALRSLARVLERQGQSRQGKELLEAYLREPGHANDVAALTALAEAYRRLPDPVRAEATARRALQQSGGSVEAFRTLARVAFDQGRVREAEFIAGSARKFADDDPGLHDDLGFYAWKLDDTARAFAEFDRALKLDPEFVPAHLDRGRLALGYRDYARAEQAFAKAAALEPGSFDARLGLAWSLDGQKARDAKKAAAAGAAFERALALRADSAEALCGAGGAYAADRASWGRAETFLGRCRNVPGTSVAERDRIAAQVRSLQALANAQSAERTAGDTGPVPAPNPTHRSEGTGTGASGNGGLGE